MFSDQKALSEGCRVPQDCVCSVALLFSVTSQWSLWEAWPQCECAPVFQSATPGTISPSEAPCSWGFERHTLTVTTERNRQTEIIPLRPQRYKAAESIRQFGSKLMQQHSTPKVGKSHIRFLFENGHFNKIRKKSFEDLIKRGSSKEQGDFKNTESVESTGLDD